MYVVCTQYTFVRISNVYRIHYLNSYFIVKNNEFNKRFKIYKSFFSECLYECSCYLFIMFTIYICQLKQQLAHQNGKT